MQTWIEENQTLLWERDPALAWRIACHEAGSPALEGRKARAEADSDDLAWVERQIPLLQPDRVGVVFGLGPHAWALRERASCTLWVVEPSLDRLLELVTLLPLKPLILGGRLLVGESPDQVVKALCSMRSLTLLWHPVRREAAPAYYAEIEQRLQERAARVTQARQRNELSRLLEKAGPDSALGRLLAGLPPGAVTVEAVNELISRQQLPWDKAERLIATMNSFK